MKRIIFALCLALLGTGVSWAKKAVVWDTPAIGYGTNNGDGFFNLSLDVTRVELRDDETVLSMTLRIRPDRKHDYLFAPDTRLRAGGKDYALVSVEGLEPGKPFQTDSEAELQAVFHFRPVPRDVRSIDFVEGDGKGFRIEGIRPPQECWDSLVPSYWRNEATGAWEIAFMDSCAIYGCRFWQYERRDIDPKTGRAEMTLHCGDEELRVFVGENRKGRREMRIGQERLVCSMLTGRYLPDYPVADTRPGFADNGYSRDTVTVTGWLKDMPERFRKERTFSLGYSDILSGEYVETFADLDERGRFTVRIPVTGCTEFSCDCGHSFVRTMLEPGRTYFMLYDFKEGRRYFMGDDVRLQNELFRFPMDWNCLRMEDGDDFDRFFASVDSLLRARSAYIDSFCAAHPSLSARFRAYREGNTLWQQAREFGQARFRRKEHCLPDSALRYARVNFWDKLPTQLTMYRDISQFLTDFIAEFFRSEPLVVYNKYLHGQLDKIASNDEELAVLTRWEALTREVQARVDAAPTMEEKVRIWSNSLDKDGVVLANKRQEIMKGERVSNIVTTLETAGQMREYVHILDSLRANTAVRNIWPCHFVLGKINGYCESLPDAVLDTLRTLVDNPLDVEMVEQRNAYFRALENREFDSLVLRPSSDLQGISEGKALLDKILEPFRGKMVLLDVWGTWCGPCKEALKHTTEEYARLSKYDVAYVYLANNSPQDSWENIIKMYNVSGENVAHYNLPDEQQRAIERYLGVSSFPTYKLFDREGNMLDVKVSARDLDGLERLLKNL